MRRILTLSVLMGLATPPALAEDPPSPAVSAPRQQLYSERLPNGLQVSVLVDHDMPVVATQMWVQVGSAQEAANEQGFAHLFEHFMFGATTNYPKEAYSRHHTTWGGNENAYTSFDNTVYISEIAPEAHDQVLVFESDRDKNLILSAENLANEQKIVTEELRLRTENDPFSRLLNPALKALFGEHPYSHSPAGTKEDIAKADLELVKKFYQGYYHPANMHLVVVGPLDPEATLVRIRELFGEERGEALTPPPVPPLATWTMPEQVELQEDIPPIKVAALVYVGPTRSDADYWSWRLLTEMLAGGEQDLFREELVTRRGKAVEAATLAEDLKAGAILAFGSISLPLKGKNRCFSLLEQSLDTLNEGAWMTDQNLETARRRLLRRELERSYYAASMADAIGQAYAWQGDDSLALGGATAAIDAVTLDQVRATWDRYVAQAQPTQLYLHKGAAGTGGVE